MTVSPSIVRAAPAVTLSIIAAIASWVTVAAIRRYTLRRGILDRPNERSSHTVPTPRGGGLGAIVVLLGVVVQQVVSGGLAGDAALAIGTAVAIVAWVGWRDDQRAVPVLTRLAVHFGAGVAVAMVATAADVGAPIPLPAFAASVWWVVWTMSAINVINFMDGIDGLIASQVSLYAAFVTCAVPAGSAAQGVAAGVVGATLGFLVWNWSPARIFMGDVGSGTFGVVLVLLGITFMREKDVSVVRAYLPLAPLFSDALVTLVRRLTRGVQIWTAHREHLYQRLANGPWSHARTTLVYGFFAAVGAAIALVTPSTLFPAAAAAYAALLIASGLLLERVASLPTRAHREHAVSATAR